MAFYDYCCPLCSYEQEFSHSMNVRLQPSCPKCPGVMEKQIAAPSFSFRAGSHVDPVYYGQLARRMPYGKADPKAWFTSQSKAEDAAKRQCDRTGETFEKAT